MERATADLLKRANDVHPLAQVQRLSVELDSRDPGQVRTKRRRVLKSVSDVSAVVAAGSAVIKILLFLFVVGL